MFAIVEGDARIYFNADEIGCHLVAAVSDQVILLKDSQCRLCTQLCSPCFCFEKVASWPESLRKIDY